MKIAIRYQSHGGNTKSVAEAIAKVSGVAAEPIDTPIKERVDLLIVGGGVYKWGLDKSLVSYLENLSPDLVGKVAAFTTAGGMNKTKDIEGIVKSKGISISSYNLSVLFLVKNHAWLGGKGFVDLTDKQTAAISEFVGNVVAESSK